MTFDLLTESQKTALFSQQADLQILSVDRGVQRSRQIRAIAKDRGQLHTLTPQQTLIAQCLQVLIPAVTKLQQSVMSGQGQMGIHKWGIPILSISAQRIALITLINAVNGLQLQQISLTGLSIKIANDIKSQRQFSIFKKDAPKVFQLMSSKVKKWNRGAFQRMHIKSKVADQPWNHSQKVWLGTVLINALVESTGKFVYQKIYRNGQTQGSIRMTDQTLAQLSKQASQAQILKPFMLPMVVPPKDWSNDNRFGGYLFFRRDLMKPNVAGDKEHAKNTSRVTVFPQAAISAVNKLQATPYQVNKFVLDVMQSLWKQGGNLPGMPHYQKIPLPPIPMDMDTNPQAKQEWKFAACVIHGKNAKMLGQRKMFMQLLWIARRMSRYSQIWFPLQMDWRTRLYPVPIILNPQGDDCAKALLRFGRRKALGNSGLRWLRIHLANSIGWDKLPFEQRIYRVRQLEESGQLARWVANPLGNRGWLAQSIDSPWQTIAAAKELVEALNSGDPQKYESSLIVSIDGSCNGIQHLSALGRDQVGGSQTNLVPSAKPSDVYSTVCAQVNRIVELHCRATHDPTILGQEDLKLIGTFPKGMNWKQQCFKWQGKVERATVKRSVMTKPYGLSMQGCRTQLVGDGHCDDMVRPFQAADYMKTVLFYAIGRVVIAAKTMMDWFQQVAQILGAIEQPISWTTPVGIKCTQAYRRLKQQRVVTLLQQVYLRVADQTAKLDVRAQVRAIVPNFIHSLDSSHLCMTANAHCTKDIFLSPVHDSYGTHACDVQSLAYHTRDQFVKMHQQPLLQRFVAGLPTGPTYPQYPTKGNLDIEQVKNSPYFFH